MKEKFESWMLRHFGEKVDSVLAGFDGESYPDETINNLWIGFERGMTVSGNLSQKHISNCGCTDCS